MQSGRTSEKVFSRLYFLCHEKLHLVKISIDRIYIQNYNIENKHIVGKITKKY